MTVNDLVGLFDYNHWANEKLFLSLSQLTSEQFTRPMAGDRGSIRDILVHLLSAEWGWIDRCGGPKRGPALNPADYATVEALLETHRQVEGYIRTFLSQLKDEDVERNIDYFGNPQGEKHSMPLGELLQHILVHGIHHRGQVALLLQVFGYSFDDFDILFYHAERRGVTAW